MIKEVLSHFQEATRFPVRLVEGDAALEMPSFMHETCGQHLQLSETAVECLRFHRGFNALQVMKHGVCPCGLLYGIMTIENADQDQVLARVEIGPLEAHDKCESPLYLLEFLASIFRRAAEEHVQHADPACPEFLRKALQYIEANLDHPIALADVARTVALSPDRFGRVFHKHIGKTFSSYVAELRIGRACRMLKNRRGARISDIAMDCGFESIPYFNRMFVRHTGISPSLYRTRYA
jgi:AraC-like DNA-binding protein